MEGIAFMPSKRPRVVFTCCHPDHRKIIWSGRAQAKAGELGLDLIQIDESEKTPDRKFWESVLVDADAIITTWEAPRLEGAILDRNPNLKFVGHAAGSVTGIVSPELFERGVVVSTANQLMAESVAEWSLMMTLIGLRHLHEYVQFGTEVPLRWSNRKALRKSPGRRIGIWGYGDVAKATIRYLRALEIDEILVCDEFLSEKAARSERITKVDLNTLLKRSDVIHLLQSLTPESEGRIGKQELSLIQPGVTLINCGRAHLVREEDLLESLKENRFLFISDVHYEEPRSENSPFAVFPNVITTPHCAGSGREFRFAISMLEEFGRLQRKEPMLYAVDPERVAHMTLEKVIV